MTRVIDIESVPSVERQHVREGVFRAQTLLAGEPGTPGNFALVLSDMPQTYYSPRHRHNFDQVRFQIEGEFDYDSDGKMGRGSIAYFPEGTPYGPQSSTSASLTLVLQFGGASRSGYLSMEQYEKAQAELTREGSFSKGVYTRMSPDGRKLNKDAYQAVWEHVNGRPLVYPAPRYAKPVFMAPENFAWLPLAGEPGASRKRLGEFTECRTRISLYRIDEGSRARLEEHAIYFVISGSGTVDGARFAKHSTIHVGTSEQTTAAAKETTELLQLGLPYLS